MPRITSVVCALLGAILPAWACGEEQSRWSPVTAKYEIEVVENPTFPVKSFHGEIDAQVASESELDRYAEILNAEFTVYPPNFIEKSQIQKIVLCQDLTFAGQKRWAIPEFEHHTLYLDIHNDSTDYLRRVIHHDVFHLVDVADDGHLLEDARWAALNPTDFRYGNGGASALNDSSTSVLTDKYPGFLNHYSTTGIEEDKAEIFCYMIMEPEHIEQQSSKNPVMKLKVEMMRSLVLKLSPEMNDEFWGKIKSRREPASPESSLTPLIFSVLVCSGVLGSVMWIRQRRSVFNVPS